MNKITFAVFGDVHGALEQMFEACRKYEEYHQEKIDYILQTGDMGVFCYESNLDKATRRFASKDPTELGCMPYISGTEEAPIPVVFVAGNHEDFEFLNQCQDNYIDPNNKIFHIKSGNTFSIDNDELQVTIAGLDGIPNRGAFSDNSQERTYGPFCSVRAINTLLSYSRGSVDILLCHAGPKSPELVKLYPACGTENIRGVIESLQPKYCFYGHYSHCPEPFKIGKTICIGLENPNPRYYKLTNRECNMLILKATFENNIIEWEYKILEKSEV